MNGWKAILMNKTLTDSGYQTYNNKKGEFIYEEGFDIIC